MLTTKERDRILIYGTLKEQYTMLIEATGIIPSCDEAVHAAVNKAITAITYLPKHFRDQSKRWLVSHGYESWEDS